MFTYLFGKEIEEVDKIFVASHKVFPHFFVLCGNSHWASVKVAFAHQYATQYNKCTGGKAVFFGTK